MRKLRHLTADQEREVFNERESGIKRKDILNRWSISERHLREIISKFGGKLKDIVLNINI